MATSLHRLGWLLAALALCLAVSRLGRQVPRLISGADGAGVDLELRRRGTQTWFAGGRPYTQTRLPEIYPPATYLMLRPLIGWASRDTARVVWVVVLVLALAVTSVLAWRITSPAPSSWRAFAAILPWAVYPAAYAFSYGQMGPLCVAAALSAMLFMTRPASPRRGVASGLLLTLSLIKPSLSVPWVAALITRAAWRRIFWVTAAAYLAATLLAMVLGAGPLGERALGWLGAGTVYSGYGNLSEVVAAVGARRLALPAGALLLASYLAWAGWRRADLWTAAAVGAIVARWFVYHNAVDDGLLLVPLLVMIRHLGEAATPARAAGVLGPLLVGCAAMFIPTRLHAARGTSEMLFESLVILAFGAAMLYFVSRRPSRIN